MKLDMAFFGWMWLIMKKWEYFSHTKASSCQIFCSGGEEQACGGLRVQIILSVAPVYLCALLFASATLELLFLSSLPHWVLQLHKVTSR